MLKLHDQVRYTLPYATDHAEASVELLLEHTRGADALISIPYQVAGPIVADLLRLPYASVHFAPFATTRRPWMSEVAGPAINGCRKRFGLEPLDDPLCADGLSSQLALMAVSPHVFERPRRWPEHVHLTGFFFLDESNDVDPALAEFVDSGDPPVVLGFGSTFHDDPTATARMLMAASAKAGVRAIIQQGWSGFGAPDPPPGVLFTSFAPHAWLFPRAACVVHAGGAGTTAAALRAGVPSVVVPHFLDQHVWAALACEHEYASARIPIGELTVDALALAIRAALDSPRIKDSCRRVGEQIRAESGVSRACDLLEALVRR